MTLLRRPPPTTTITNVKVKTITDELFDVLIHRSKGKKKEKEHLDDDDDENDYDKNKTKTNSQTQEQQHQEDQNDVDFGVTVIDWDDGHIPSGCNNRKSKMVIHDQTSPLQLQSKSRSRSHQQQHVCAVIDNAISTKTADAIYQNAIGKEEQDKKDITTNSGGENEHDKVWGEYIKLENIHAIMKDYEEHNNNSNNINKEAGVISSSNDTDYDDSNSMTSSNTNVINNKNNQQQRKHHSRYSRRHYLAAVAVYELFLKSSNEDGGNDDDDDDMSEYGEQNHPHYGFHHLLRDDVNSNRIHGISVWVICSTINDRVQYHIDYAEMFRYQTNVIYPPMYGSTLQVSPINKSKSTKSKSNSKSTTVTRSKLSTAATNDDHDDTSPPTRTHDEEEEVHMKMKGGNFYVNTSGLDHYSKYKYKCSLDELDLDLEQQEANDNDDIENDNADDDITSTLGTATTTTPATTTNDNTNTNNSNWIKVRYKYNRATLCDGTLPHFSSPITYLSEPRTRTPSINPAHTSVMNNHIHAATPTPTKKDKHKRVIVGFNICNQEIGPLVEQYPEHSSKFNKYVKICQATQKFTTTNTNTNTNPNITTAITKGNQKGGGGGGFSIEDAKRNPKIASFIKLLAKKYKENMLNQENEKKDQQEKGESQP